MSVNSTFLQWIGLNRLCIAKIYESYVKCEHNHSNKQLARLSKVTIELV